MSESDRDPKPFNKDVSANVDELVTLSACPTAASDINQLPPSENEHNSINSQNVQGSESDNADTNPIISPSECPEDDLDNDSEGSSTSECRPLVQERSVPNAQPNRTDANVIRSRKRFKVAKYICLVSLKIALIVLALSFWTGFGFKYRSLSPTPLEIINSYTRTGTNALLAAFSCAMTSCDISEVDIKVVLPAKPDQIDYFLTDCSNVIYGHLEVHKDYVSSLNDANIPESIITEDYLMKNYFSGQLSILVHATPLSFQDNAQHKSELYLCHFVDPVKFNLFLELGTYWREYVEVSACKIVEIDSVINARNYTITFDTQQPSFVFVGAVLTSGSYLIRFGYSVVGHEIIAINNSQICNLNFNKVPPTPHCSIFVNKTLATGSKMCVLGKGVSENDGRYQYTKAAVSIKHISHNEFLITMIVCCLITICLMLLCVVSVYCLHKHCTVQTSAQEYQSETDEHAIYDDIIKNQQRNCQSR